MSKPRLLYVEDDPTNVFVMERLLKDELHVTIAASADACFDYLVQESFDIILMDINLGSGRLSGIDCKDIIRNEMKIDTPIIALTSYSSHMENKSFIEIGFDNHITKPVEKKSLLEEIKKTLKK